MEPVVTAAEMREHDRFAIEKLKIPGLALMENAGRGVVELMRTHFGNLAGKHIFIFCGKGNNGGDGFVVARHLLNDGSRIVVIILAKPSQYKMDAKTNFASLRQIQRRLRDETTLRILEFRSVKMFDVLPSPDLVVDAIFGTGFNGRIDGRNKRVIEWINSLDVPRMSIDMPSGVNADNGLIENLAAKASLTATMGFKKIGLITGKGCDYAGRVEVVDIGVPVQFYRSLNLSTGRVGREDIRGILPRRARDAHKHAVGKVVVVAGSRGLTGAPALTSVSALRAGAGAVVLGTPASVYPVLSKKLTEVMVFPLQDTAEGTLALGSFGEIEKYFSWADILVIGPGLTRNEETQQLVWKLLAKCELPMVIDADGLNALSEKISVLRRRSSKNVILTPHTGELSRLISTPSAEIEKERVRITKEVAREFGATVVLKGSPTVTASEDGRAVINSTGNPGMATAGAGDVLAGMIGAFWAQGMKRHEAAYSAVYVHGLSGDLAGMKYGERSLIATDIQAALPGALRETERSRLR